MLQHPWRQVKRAAFSRGDGGDPGAHSPKPRAALNDEVMGRFLEKLMGASEVKPLLSDEHVSVDGTLLQAWVSHALLKRIDGEEDPPPPPFKARQKAGERRFLSGGIKLSNKTDRSGSDQVLMTRIASAEDRSRTALDPSAQASGEALVRWRIRSLPCQDEKIVWWRLSWLALRLLICTHRVTIQSRRSRRTAPRLLHCPAHPEQELAVPWLTAALQDRGGICSPWASPLLPELHIGGDD